MILVTKDWNIATVDVQVTRLKAADVSSWWIREENRKQMARPDMLYALARDIDRVAFAIETAPKAVHIVSSVGRHARPIELPYAKRLNTTRRLPERPRPRRPRRRLPIEAPLFPDM
jgi:hypothetical protein